MKFDAVRFCRDYNIPFYLEGKNVQDGMVGIRCPMCDDHSNHGGFNPSKAYYTCWRCGYTPIRKVIRALIPSNTIDMTVLQAEYSMILSPELMWLNSLHDKGSTFADPNKTLDVPGDKPLNTKAVAYINGRSFDANYLQHKYDLRSTGRIGRYKFRIIMPVIYENRIVSFQGRDYTERAELRYKDCEKDKAIIYHKELLYNLDNCKLDHVLVTEGVTDVWRLGDNCACTFGTGFTREQINLLTRRFKHVSILYDSEPTARKKAESAIIKLLGFGVDADFAPEINVEDPANMSKRDALLYKRDLRLY